MGGRRREAYSARAFFVSVAWIVMLLVCYWVLSAWPVLPRLITSAFATIE
ncbi:MAG: hypothetical protein J0H19_05895 [Rhodospirillales bacterium]|nr:hypothetical protein [Rhodospirillales bacterium]